MPMRTTAASLLWTVSFVSALVGPIAAGTRGAARDKGSDPIVTVSAGDLDRLDTVVRFILPKDLPGGSWELRDDADGSVTPLQVIPPTGEGAGDVQAVFILKELKAGQTKRYHLQPTKAQAGVAASPAEAEAVKEGGAVALKVGGREVLRYLGEKSMPPAGYDPSLARGGYIHPVYTPSGKPVTDDYPPNHKHHHGIWSPWTKTEFEGRHPDFWNMGAGTGSVEFVALCGTWSGPAAAGFCAKHRFMDLTAQPQPKAALNEQWEVNVYAVGTKGDRPYYLFDWQSTQTCASDSPLKLPEYRYGGLGFRGHRQWDGRENCFFLTSEGITDRIKGHATRARWCHVGGNVDGQLAGVAILDHPANFRHPQSMRIHDTEPFFNFAPTQLGDFAIEPGTPYVMRYRFIVSDGPPDRELIERVWNDFARPPEVTVGAGS